MEQVHLMCTTVELVAGEWVQPGPFLTLEHLTWEGSVGEKHLEVRRPSGDPEYSSGPMHVPTKIVCIDDRFLFKNRTFRHHFPIKLIYRPEIISVAGELI